MCATLNPIAGDPVFRSNYKALYNTMTNDIYLRDLVSRWRIIAFA